MSLATEQTSTIPSVQSLAFSLPHLVGQKVRVYRNLRNRCFSVQIGGRVIAHAKSIALSDATFKVSEASRQRVLKSGRKNVHAFVIGTVLPAESGQVLDAVRQVTYNPYSSSSFKDCKSQIPITSAKTAVLALSTVWVSSD
jgi:hypothetical protein